jgi:hypothetical protein
MVGSAPWLGCRGERELAAADRNQPLVGVSQTVLRQVTDFKSHVDL